MTRVFQQISFVISFITLVVCDDDDHDEEETITKAQAWGFGFLASFSLSLMGLLFAIIIVYIQDCIDQKKFKIFTNLLYSLGCGALIGDAVVHILPHSYEN